MEPESDPLGEYLASLAALRQAIPEDALTLPATTCRLPACMCASMKLARHHAERCGMIADACRAEPHSAGRARSGGVQNVLSMRIRQASRSAKSWRMSIICAIAGSWISSPIAMVCCACGRSRAAKHKRCPHWDPASPNLVPYETKVFWFFFAKKNCLLSWPSPRPPLLPYVAAMSDGYELSSSITRT